MLQWVIGCGSVERFCTMDDQLKRPSSIPPSGEIVAQNISREDFLTYYVDPEIRYEWVDGTLINIGFSTPSHRLMATYFQSLFSAYLHFTRRGKLYREHMMVHLPNSTRLPDLFFVSAANPSNIDPHGLYGTPDLCIEIVSEESLKRDYVEKLAEYEASGVQEYWLIDPNCQRAIFYRLESNGFYARFAPSQEGCYETPLLPKLQIHVPTLWQEELPHFYVVGEVVKSMFCNSNHTLSVGNNNSLLS
jgi:Uma2 family endonuclease